MAIDVELIIKALDKLEDPIKKEERIQKLTNLIQELNQLLTDTKELQISNVDLQSKVSVLMRQFHQLLQIQSVDPTPIIAEDTAFKQSSSSRASSVGDRKLEAKKIPLSPCFS